MGYEVPVEENGVYTFKCGRYIYTYRTKNEREYTNNELMNIIKSSWANWKYYEEPSTTYNDIDGWFETFPRNKKNDEAFLKNVKIILENTQSDDKKQLINKILNKCLVVDKEPKLKDGSKLDDVNLDLSHIEKMGKYHIDQYKLDDIYRSAINFSVHQYIKKLNFDGRYSDKENKELELLLNDK